MVECWARWAFLVATLWVPLSRLAVHCQSQCTQDVLDQTFVTVCALSRCESLFEQDQDSKSNASQRTPSEWPSSRAEVVHIVSSRAGDRFKVNRYPSLDTTERYYEPSRVNGSIFVEPNVKYQRILGFGSSLTDASSTNIDALPGELRSRLIRDYFDTESGIGLNLIKVPIGSTQYSYTNYVLDQPSDASLELSAYDVDHRIPIVKEAVKAAGRFRNRVKLVASSLSAPPELKENQRMIQGGSLRRDKVPAYARYLQGFLQAYAEQGVNVWALMLSEAPVSSHLDKGLNESLDYNSMAMSPSECSELAQSLVKLRQANGNSRLATRLLILGDDKANVPVWSDAMLGNPQVASKIAGIAYKCDRNSAAPYDSLVYATKRHPAKYLLAQGAPNRPMKLGNWQHGENYATEMVKNLQFNSVAWLDFNLALNLDGGPWVSSKFKADAAVVVDPRKLAYYRNPMFYAIGHLSKYVRPGSVRVRSNFYSSAQMFAQQHVAFVTPENYLVVFVANNNIGPMPISVGVGDRTRVEVLLATKSFNTFLLKL